LSQTAKKWFMRTVGVAVILCGLNYLLNWGAFGVLDGAVFGIVGVLAYLILLLRPMRNDSDPSNEHDK
jgi:hypothetical protein